MQFEGKSPKHCMRLLNPRQRKYILFFKLSRLPMSDLKKNNVRQNILRSKYTNSKSKLIQQIPKQLQLYLNCKILYLDFHYLLYASLSFGLSSVMEILFLTNHITKFFHKKT